MSQNAPLLLVLCLYLGFCLFTTSCDPDPPRLDSWDATVISPPPQPQRDGGLSDPVDMELPGPLFNSILPASSPVSGGVNVRLIGGDFRQPMFVRIGGQPCTTLTIESRARMTCLVPSVDAPGRVDVSVGWLDPALESNPSDVTLNEVTGGLRVINEGFTYFEVLSVDRLQPEEGPASGNTEVILEGEGFTEPLEVRFGGVIAQNVTVESPQRARVITPPNEAGRVDVQVRTTQNSITLDEAFNFITALGVDDITPRWSPLSGGVPFSIYGYGFLATSDIQIGDRPLIDQSITPPSLIQGTTPSQPQPGWAPIRINNSNGTYLQERGILYLPEEDGPFTVYGVDPNELPSDRGGSVLIGGNGFNENTRVTLDGERIGCQLDSPQRLRCFLPAYPPQETSITVSNSLLQEVLPFRFVNELELYQLIPDRAAISGGALIHAYGRGFTNDTQFTFGDIDVPIEELISESEALLRVPPHPESILDITLTDRFQTQFIPQLFTYFNPLSQFGGSWGDVIEGAINVTVLNIYDFSPVPEATVEARRYDNPTSPPLLSGQTDENGQLTLSIEGLSAPLHLNIAKADFEAQTVERVVSENFTALLYPFVPPEGEGEPPPPPEPVRLSGLLTGLNDLPKPLEPGYVIRAFIDFSHRSRLGRSTLPAPNPLGILSEDGPFEVINTAGQFSLIATAAYVPIETLERYERGEISYWLMRRECRPLQMGLIRFLSLSPGAELTGLTLNLDYSLDQNAEVRLINPSSAAGEVYNDGLGEISILEDDYEVRAFLDLGPDGYWELDLGATSTEPRLDILGLPTLSEWIDAPGLSWYAQAKIYPQRTNSFANKEQSDLDQVVEIGPFVGAPRLTSHGFGGTFTVGDVLTWTEWPGVSGGPVEPAQATTIRFFQAGVPMWTFTLPGGVNQLTIPPLPPAEAGAGIAEGSVFVFIETIANDFGLDYQDYTLLDLNSPTTYSRTFVELFFSTTGN